MEKSKLWRKGRRIDENLETFGQRRNGSKREEFEEESKQFEDEKVKIEGARWGSWVEI